MYDENERNERHDQDVDYTEGAYSDSAYEEKNNDTAKKEETSDYGGYHDSRYRGSLDGEPEAAAGADPKEKMCIRDSFRTGRTDNTAIHILRLIFNRT